MEQNYFKKTTSIIILGVLVVLSFFILQKILLAIIFGILLAFILSPIYDWLIKKIPSKTISGLLICVSLLFAILIPIWFLLPVLMEESIKTYASIQKIDFVGILDSIFPSVFTSEKFSPDIGSIIQSFTGKITNSFLNYFTSTIFNFPIIFLQMTLTFFVVFFVLKDKEKLVSYIKSLLPFSKEVETKLFNQTKGITFSILIGQFLLGIAQGIFVGIGFFLFGVPNAFLLTLLACFAGLLPMVGTTIIWLPVAIYLIAKGSIFYAIGIAAFGLIAMFVDNIFKPVFVSKKTTLPASLVLVGMIGGYLFMGLLGFILGPLILAYLLIVLEIYRDKKVPGLLVQEKPHNFKISF